MTAVPRDHLETIYADGDDPWGFRTSAYEQAKFRATRAALGRPSYASALEIGCGNGELARHIAPICDQYTGVDAVETALQEVGLARAADRRADQCSQGMVKRADLARALISRPTLLLLDEPHAGLDPAASELVDFLLAEVRERGGAALVVSHDRDRLQEMVDAVFELRDGGLVPLGLRQ